MSPFSAFVVFLLIWWVTLFGVLPMGVGGQAEEGDVFKGSEPGAPVQSDIKRKFVITTMIAAVLWVIVCTVIISGVLSWNDLGLHLPGGNS